MFKKMIKNIIFSAMAGVMALSCVLFAACGEKTPPEESDEYIDDPALWADFSKEYKEYNADALNTQGNTWEPLYFTTAEAKAAGLKGGTACQHLNYITRAHNNKNIMFFGTDACGMGKSTDGGKSWKPCLNGLYTKAVCGIECDPKNDNHVIAVNGCGSEATSIYSTLRISFNCGDIWEESRSTEKDDKDKNKELKIGFAGTQYFYNTLAFDESSYDANLGYCKDVYYCTVCERDSASKLRNDKSYADRKGMYYSNDGGKTFGLLANTAELTDGMISITNKKFAVANQNGIFVRNRQGSFDKVSSMCVQSFEYVNGKYYILVAGDYKKGSTDDEKRPDIKAEDGIYVSNDLSSFTKITNADFPNQIPRNLKVSEHNENYMVMFARKRINNRYAQRPYYSKDGGKTWTLTEPTTTSELFYYYTWHNGTFTYDPDDENVIVGIIGGEVIRSEDGGASFLYSGSGVHNVSLGGQMHFNIYNEDLVYVGAYDFGGALTTDGGKTWKNVSLSKDGDGRDIMGGYAADENTLFGAYVDTWTDSTYFSNYRYVCYSHDGGKTANIDPSKVIRVEEYKNPTKEDIYADLKIDKSIATCYESSYQSPNDKNVLFCCNYRSTDNGYTWKNMLTTSKGEPCLQVYTHSGRALYGCNKEGYVLRSLDDGKTWKKVNSEALPVWTVTLKDDDGKWYSRPVSGPSHITDIAIDAKNGYIYVCYYRRLIRMKLDGTEVTVLNDANKETGYTGMDRNNFANTINIRSVAVDPNYPEIIYVCGSGDFYFDCESVRRSYDSGKSWQTITPSRFSQNTVMTDNSSLGFEGRCIRVRSNGEVWLAQLCLGYCKLKAPYEYVGE